MEGTDNGQTPIVKIRPEDASGSLRASLSSLAQNEGPQEVIIEAEPVKKKTVRGLHLPVRAFKSRENRDPNNVNEELKVQFDDIINEPEGFYTPKFSWHLSNELYGFGRACCYSVTTLFCGIPFSFIWGVIFAFLACLNVWVFAPCKRGHLINLSCISGFWATCVSALCDPFYRSIGLVFSNLRVRTEKFVV